MAKTAIIKIKQRQRSCDTSHKHIQYKNGKHASYTYLGIL